MKKPTEKRIKECLKNIDDNFSELVNAIIWYEQNDMDDWASDIIGEIEKIPSEKEVALLFNDLTSRKHEDFEVYSYKRLWWALINAESEDMNTTIVNFCKNAVNGKTLTDKLSIWFNELGEGIDTKYNIGKIIKGASKHKS